MGDQRFFLDGGAGLAVPAAVAVADSREIAFERCAFQGLGGAGISVRGTRGFALDGCLLSDVAAGGVAIAGSSEVEVRECVFQSIGWPYAGDALAARVTFASCAPFFEWMTEPSEAYLRGLMAAAGCDMETFLCPCTAAGDCATDLPPWDNDGPTGSGPGSVTDEAGPSAESLARWGL